MASENLIELVGKELDLTASDVPLYKRLKSAIEAAIRSNALKAGAVLPGERVLAETLSLSRVTVRKALALLEEEGLLNRRHGFRTEVGSRVGDFLARHLGDDVELDHLAVGLEADGGEGIAADGQGRVDVVLGARTHAVAQVAGGGSRTSAIPVHHLRHDHEAPEADRTDLVDEVRQMRNEIAALNTRLGFAADPEQARPGIGQPQRSEAAALPQT